MELCSIEVTGFRRFLKKASLRTNGKLVALLGPNEAGKSSLLRALQLVGSDVEPADGDFARGGASSNLRIVAHFFLSREDREAAGLTDTCWMKVVKTADGTRRYGFSPVNPERDMQPRRAVISGLAVVRDDSRVATRLEGELAGRVNSVLRAVEDAGEDLDEETIDAAVDVIVALEPYMRPRDPAPLRRLPGVVPAFERAEKAENPVQLARNVLRDRVPQILEFGEDARDLRSSYPLDQLAEAVPLALRNLCSIAELEIEELLAAHTAGRVEEVTTLENAANERLRERAKRDWQQSRVRVSLRVQDGRLRIQVVDQYSAFTSFQERSDGLRQFVALQAFATGLGAQDCILLIDEAEQRLHYDAQADLVQMLSRQNLAAKVIYTTHSAGCLPEDLGNGVRLVQKDPGNDARSRIVNKFWAEDGDGLVPLLFGMGASTLAFFPTRNAVMVEGPSDMLLLPSMFRAALGTCALGFQFVPGLSVSAQENNLHAPAIGSSNGMFYLTDGDGGGAKLRARLISAGIDQEDIFTLRSGDGAAVEPEDFLEPTLLLEAINRLLARHHVGVAPLVRRDLTGRSRMAGLETAFKTQTGIDLPKVELAYEILDLGAENPQRRLLDERRSIALAAVCRAITARVAARGLSVI